jgi:hypothetical protein
VRTDSRREQDRSTFGEKGKDFLQREELAFDVNIKVFVERRLVDRLKR